jgi:hypothetical protein
MYILSKETSPANRQSYCPTRCWGILPKTLWYFDQNTVVFLENTVVFFTGQCDVSFCVTSRFVSIRWLMPQQRAFREVALRRK